MAQNIPLNGQTSDQPLGVPIRTDSQGTTYLKGMPLDWETDPEYSSDMERWTEKIVNAGVLLNRNRTLAKGSSLSIELETAEQVVPEIGL